MFSERKRYLITASGQIVDEQPNAAISHTVIAGGRYNKTSPLLSGRPLDPYAFYQLLAANAADPPSDFNLSLLRSCRDLYHEACLLPYELNLFSFDNYGVFRKGFLDKLRPC